MRLLPAMIRTPSLRQGNGNDKENEDTCGDVSGQVEGSRLQSLQAFGQAAGCAFGGGMMWTRAMPVQNEARSRVTCSRRRKSSRANGQSVSGRTQNTSSWSGSAERPGLRSSLEWFPTTRLRTTRWTKSTLDTLRSVSPEECIGSGLSRVGRVAVFVGVVFCFTAQFWRERPHEIVN